MLVEVLDVSEEDRPVLRHLLELYRYDFSEFDDADVGAHGEFGYRYLDHYWTDPERRPLLFRTAGRWSGFALVRTGDPNDMAEFFVLRKYRRTGVGSEAAARGSSSVSGPVDGSSATGQLSGDRVLADGDPVPVHRAHHRHREGHGARRPVGATAHVCVALRSCPCSSARFVLA